MVVARRIQAQSGKTSSGLSPSAARQAIVKLGLLFFLLVAGLEVDLGALKRRTNERKEKLCELLVGRNVTVHFAAQALGVGERAARDYLNALVDERRALRWTAGGLQWFGISQAELTRRNRCSRV